MRGGYAATLLVLSAVAWVGCTSSEAGPEPAADSDRPGGTWQRLPPSSGAREGYQELEAVRAGRRMVIVGGVGYDQNRLGGVVFDLEGRRSRRIVSPLRWRFGYSAVAARDEVVVWGGCCGPGGSGRRDQGMRYQPGNDRWLPMTRSPLGRRREHAAVWTGEEMIVWGGFGNSLERRADGAAYRPETDSWRPIAPAPMGGRSDAAAVWTGREMIVWGGAERRPRRDFQLLTAGGAAYDPARDRWRRIARAPVRSREGSRGAAALWTGSAMLVWNGTAGAVYDPRADRWRRMPDPPLEGARYDSTAVWTGREMIVSGGDETGGVNGAADGAAYEPGEDHWRRVPTAPIEGRYQHAGAWTGKAMLVWGGCCKGSRQLGDGALYSPGEDPRAPAPASSDTHIGGLPVDIAATHRSVWVLTCTHRCAGDARQAGGELVRVDAASGRVRWRSRVSNPHALAVGAGGVWVIDFWNGTVQRIDSATGRVEATIRLRLPRPVVRSDHAFLPDHVTTGDGSVWVTTARGYVARIDPSHNRVSAMFRAAFDSAGATLVTGSALWVVESPGVRRVDTRTGRAELVTVERRGRSFTPDSVGFESGSLWVSGVWVRGNAFSEDDEPALIEIPEAGREARKVVALPRDADVVGAGAGSIWLTAFDRPLLYRFDAGARRIADTLRLPDRRSLVAVAGRHVWVATRDGRLRRLR